MAAPTLKIEAGNAKMLGLAGSQTTTSAIFLPGSLTIAPTAGGDFTNFPVGTLLVGSHRLGDTLITPGGFTMAAGNVPLLSIAGADATSLTQGNRKPQPLRVHEGGALYTLPGPSFSNADPQVYNKPLSAVGGVFTCAAATANQGSFTTTLASNFGYITDLYIQLAVTSANASTLLILDASAGTTLFALNYAASALPAATAAPMMAFHFSNPLRAAAAAASFFVTTTGATTTWNISANGFFALQ